MTSNHAPTKSADIAETDAGRRYRFDRLALSLVMKDFHFDAKDPRPERVRFVMVNVREAHPGTTLPQPGTMELKTSHARRLRGLHGFAFEVAVDDIDGRLHRALSPSTTQHVLGTDGTILFRAQWANDTAALAAALNAVVAGEPPRPSQSGGVVIPTLRRSATEGSVSARPQPNERARLPCRCMMFCRSQTCTVRSSVPFDVGLITRVCGPVHGRSCPRSFDPVASSSTGMHAKHSWTTVLRSPCSSSVEFRRQ